MFPPEKIYTKVVGVTMGQKSSDGTPLRQIHLKNIKEKNISLLRLVREPDNPYDPNAIAVWANYGLGEVQIGYLKNSKYCFKCEKEQKSSEEICPKCSSLLSRLGIASTLSKYIDEGFVYKVKVLQVTGSDDKTLGCNILIERVL